MRNKVVISDKGREFIANGQLWMYRNNLESDCSGLADGSLVDIVDTAGRYLASGFYSAVSHIVVRILTHDPNTEINDAFFADKIRKAVEYRKKIMPEALTCCRMVYSEADGLPGLIVDRYNDILVTQISCAGMENRKKQLYDIMLKEIVGSRYIYERNDIEARKKEHLELYKGFYGEKSDPVTVITENSIRIRVDVENGQKTGYFLDQKANRYLIQKMSRGLRVLDCFSHTGGFALNAAKGGAREVTAVDVSATALRQGHENACLNGLESIISFKQADVFDYLDSLKKGEYDLIILDPPAFTKSRRTIDHAYNGYKEINVKAMKALNQGSYLATCSCSRYMEKDNFERMVKDAAEEAGVSLRLISFTRQSEDHPVREDLKETAYLKFYIYQIM